MSRLTEDVIDLKPNFYGFGLNLNAFWRWWHCEPDPVTIVAQRFIQIFHDHGIAISQIPRLMPELTLEHLRDCDSLLPILTPAMLQQTADLFQIQLKWLEGTSERIYDCYYCYKDPWKFFEDLKTLRVDEWGQPLTIFCSVAELDGTRDREQLLVPVLREKCAQLDDKDIYRYRIYDDGWDWGYWKSRIQLKAMTRTWDQTYDMPIPIYRVDRRVLREIESGKIVPLAYYRNSKRLNACLEDYSLAPAESRVSKESAELPEVLEYIEAYKLDGMSDPIQNPRNSSVTARFR